VKRFGLVASSPLRTTSGAGTSGEGASSASARAERLHVDAKEERQQRAWARVTPPTDWLARRRGSPLAPREPRSHAERCATLTASRHQVDASDGRVPTAQADRHHAREAARPSPDPHLGDERGETVTDHAKHGSATGVHITWSMRVAPVASITSRSNPSATPQAAGITRSAAMKSSSIG